MMLDINYEMLCEAVRRKRARDKGYQKFKTVVTVEDLAWGVFVGKALVPISTSDFSFDILRRMTH